MTYADRRDAGKQLASALYHFQGADTVIMALPRGGVVLGVEVAKELHAPLGLILVRKIGHPSYSEYAIGAVAEGDKPIYNKSEVAKLDDEWLKEAEIAAHDLTRRRRKIYFGDDIVQPEMKDKTVIIVDDGIATGCTMEAAIKAVIGSGSKKVIVAVPVASSESISNLEQFADEIVVLDDPNNFLGAVGSHYDSFEPVEDEEAKALLREAQSGFQSPSARTR